MFTITGRKQRTPEIAIFECGESGLNHTLKIGANAMIGMAFAAIAIGISAVPTILKRLTNVATAMPKSDPITKPPSASWNVVQPAGQSVWRSFQKLETIAVGFGSRNCWMWNAAIEPCQSAIASTKTASRGHPVACLACGRVHSASAASSSGSRCSPRLRRSSRTCVTSSK